jgi:mannitol-specific phosphotransferase system IIBC component
VRQQLKREGLFMKQMFDSTTKMGTAGGTLLTIFANISKEDISKTIVLAGIGAIVSFGVTLLLKVIIKKFRR